MCFLMRKYERMSNRGCRVNDVLQKEELLMLLLDAFFYTRLYDGNSVVVADKHYCWRHTKSWTGLEASDSIAFVESYLTDGCH